MCYPGVDPAFDGGEPGGAVFVGERDAGVHFLHVGRRVKIVTFLEFPAEFRCERFGDCALADAGDAHDDEHALVGHATTVVIPSAPAMMARSAMPMKKPVSMTPGVRIMRVSTASASGKAE